VLTAVFKYATVQILLWAPSGARLVTTDFSRLSLRRVVRKAASGSVKALS
jgi:hypothetical protein